MVVFCPELESGNHQSERETYRHLVNQIKVWYEESYSRFSPFLRLEAELHGFYNELSQHNNKLSFEDNLSYNFGAKLSFFSISDALVKLILSKYSYGMSREFLNTYEIDYKNSLSSSDSCWLTCKLNAVLLTEILARVLRKEQVESSFDLPALLIDRSDRGKLTHASEAVKCLSALRCYNVIREMLYFLDPECEGTLTHFEEVSFFDYDAFLSHPCHFNFDDYTTILVAGSVHDVRKDYRAAIANLPWNLVLDYDGYSDCGGLLSALSHNQVQRSVLTIEAARNLPLMSRSFTYWYRCGEYQMPFYNNKILSIPSCVSLHKGKTRGDGNADNFIKILELMFANLVQLDRPLNIVVAIEDQRIVGNIISALKNIHFYDYFITWVGLAGDYDYLEKFDENQDDLDNHFRQFNCSSTVLYEAFFQHKDSWKHRTSIKMAYTLPSAAGPVKIAENFRVSLSSYFDVLYDNANQIDSDTLEEDRCAFDRGNQASWAVIASHYADVLIKETKVEQIKSQIHMILGTINQDRVHEKLFFISHKAGLGGSTLCRQLAWELHTDYAVLVVKKYVQGEITKWVKNLYDNVLDRAPIILLADDSLPQLNSLCDDVKALERRCVLICACREDNAVLRLNKKSKREYLNALAPSAIEKLKEHYKKISPLDSQLLKHRIRDFDQELRGDLRTPFIIGLYFLEKEFNIDRYVKKALDGCVERIYQDVLAYLAICNIFDYKDVPRSLINHAAGLKPRELFHKTVSAAESMICQESISDVDNLRFKHPLLSYEYLKQYSERFFESDDKRAIFEMVKSLIHDVANMPNLSENHLDLLRYLLIQDKDVGSDDPINSSRLLQYVGGDSPKELLNQLATEFEARANDILNQPESYQLSRVDWALLQTVSHAYAHLGRFYSRIDRNPEMAEKMMVSALNYMPDADPDIYHMLGNSRFDKIRQRQEEDLDSIRNNPRHVVDFRWYEELVGNAIENFEASCEYGSPDYGYPSILKLTFSYLRFVYQVKHIQKPEDASLLSDSQVELEHFFLRTLEEARMLPQIGETAQDTIEEYRDRFHSQILFGNHAKTVEYYQNKLDAAHQRGAISEEDAMRHALVIARINLARSEAKAGESFYRFVRNQAQLLEDIEILLKRPRQNKGYGERMSRNLLFHHWIQLAKLNNQSVDSALTRIRQWYDMEEEHDQGKNPEPYYYMRTLFYLQVKEGSKRAADEVVRIDDQISYLYQYRKFDAKRMNLNKIIDVLVVGTGLGQLFDVSFCQANEDTYLSLIHQQKRTPQKLEGRMDYVLNDSLASLEIVDPFCWRHKKAVMRIGSSVRNTMSKANVNDKIQFFLGFSVNRPCALSDTAKDFDKGESLSFSQECVRITRNKSGGDSSSRSYSNPESASADVGKSAQMPELNGFMVKVFLTNPNKVEEGTFKYQGKQYLVNIVSLTNKEKKKAAKAAKQGTPINCKIKGKPTKKGYIARIVK